MSGDLIARTVQEGNLLQRLDNLERRLKVLEDNQTKRAATYTVSNAATDRTYNANATTVDELADIVATLLSDLGLR